MAKPFFEVFPTLQTDRASYEMFENVIVSRVTGSADKTVIDVYFDSERLIEKKMIYRVQKQIREQFFSKGSVNVLLHEKFHLSKQYDPMNLYEVYEESVLDEFREEDRLLYTVYRGAEISFRQNTEETAFYEMHLTVSDSVIARTVEQNLIKRLENIFDNRCGMPVHVLISYKEEEKDRFQKENAQRIEQKVAAIRNRGGKNAEMTSEENDVMKQKENTGTEGTVPHQANGQENANGSGQKITLLKNDEENNKSGNFAAGFHGQKKTFDGKRTYEGRKGFDRGAVRKSDNPDVIYGRDFDSEDMPIDQLTQEMGEVTVHGRIEEVTKTQLRTGSEIWKIHLTDYTDTIGIKLFFSEERKAEAPSELIIGNFIKVKGISQFDSWEKELMIGSVVGIKKIPDFRVFRQDHALKKRVELHCHTKMSEMDAISRVEDLIGRARDWGMTSMAITDHGNVQAFPAANHAVEKTPDFKVIYGVEAYLVDDSKKIIENSRPGSLDDAFVVFNLKTTGFSPVKNKIIEIGAVKVVKGEITDRFSSFVNPQVPIPFEIEKLTGIRDDMVIKERTIEEVLPEFLSFCGDCVLVTHNASFDMSFIKQNECILNRERNHTSLDTVGLSRFLYPEAAKHTLDAIAKRLKLPLENHHRAADHAEATAMIFLNFCSRLREDGMDTLEKIDKAAVLSKESIAKLPSHHVIVLAKNETGRVNLYRIISESHLNYFHGRPRLPKSIANKYREGLIFGSACEAGELYQAVLEERSETEIAGIVAFYDYLEIQPVGNDMFMIENDRYRSVNSVEDLKDINRRIVKLGEQYDKPVVATCDVHFLNPEDEIYRRIVMAGKGFEDADNQPPLYLRTTEEMLEEFGYLGSDKAEEVVVTNTNLIADMCDRICPISPDKCPPVIEHSDEMLTEICYSKAHAIYGEMLPIQVESRLKRELESIIKNGFAVMYIIAQKLVWKSVEDGYLVGSRGSVGSSFVATMAGITEVNPLSPHYYCLKCHYSEFESDDVKAYAGRSGCDMPDKNCPVCGELLYKDGFDIPFETFLGFKGDKEPDIDLNFSGEYQSKAHKYTEVIFGAGQTFRAGTIGTLADKTAFGYVKKYYEEKGVTKRTCEINRIVKGCVDVKRTTGQHPGGIIVLPFGYDINMFTPVQHPANDMTTDTVTTHFDYHSIDHNLLKLDILGHDDPTMIRMLQDLTEMDPTMIPLDDPGVMSLFQNTSALGIEPADIGGCELGSLGIPEFGTDFAMQMLKDTKPTSFSDLVRIAGLAHGTDVWLGNAQTLIEEGKATISTAICTRDDIMIYLIQMGVESSLSFKIMESVRKGKGLTEDMENAMVAANVPDWYIWSCKKIKYMFPKAHAAAYVMMAWRIAYCKVYQPLAYYAAYFSIRASAFSYELMCQGRPMLERTMALLRNRQDELSNKEQDTLKDMRIVQELYARGLDFTPIDLFRAKARSFQIIDGKIMPSLTSIDGLGDKAAEQITEAVKNGPFLSKDDFKNRCKVGQTTVDLFDRLKLLGDLPESNQLSFFDFI